MGRRLASLAVLAVIAAGCGDRLSSGVGGAGSPTPQPVASATAVSSTIQPSTPAPSGAPSAPPTLAPTPSPTITPPVSGALTLAQLKYRLVDRFGRLWYCDPDFYPVARADQDALAESRFPEVQKDAETFSAILGHLGYPPSSTYTHEQRVAIYTDWKMLGALHLDLAAAAYHFTARFTPNGKTGSLVDGTIDQRGQIAVGSLTASGQPPCPICLARGTRIAAPSGSVAVEDLRAGMLVWTVDERGARVAATVLVVGGATAPADHTVVDLVLTDGRELHASPGHPLADGRLLGSIAAGDVVDGSIVLSAARVAYGWGTTFDLLPAGPTGTYWADGVLLESTLPR